MRFLLLLIFVSLIGPSALAQKQPSTDKVEKFIDAFAQEQAENFQIPGLAIGVIRNGEVIYAKALGVQSMGTKAPLTNKSLFHMASVSKPFVATAMVIAEAEGHLNLDDKLVKHLPYFKMASPEYQDITLRQMLAHTSGIPDVEDYDWGNPDASDAAVEAYSKSFAETKLDFTPSSSYSYSNAAFDILADVIAKTTGMTFEQYVEKRILRPAGMQESNFSKLAIDPEYATASHIPNQQLALDVNPVYPYNRIHAPSSSLHANVEDMLRWGQLYLGKGSIDGNTIFTPSQYAALTTSNNKFESKPNVCLSWFKGTAFGDDYYYHSGGDPGFSTHFAFIPARGFAIMVMANNDIVSASSLAGIIIRYTLKKQKR
ncbi:MAG: serine hydrolase domain-containing protein, partial [Bacteroidota bacterium]